MPFYSFKSSPLQRICDVGVGDRCKKIKEGKTAHNEKGYFQFDLQRSKNSIKKYFRDLDIKKTMNDRSKILRNNNAFIIIGR